jgi:4'-phosphopantetheinyl transferase
MEIVGHIKELPELEPGDIHIWGIHVPDLLDRLDALRSVLSDKEQARADRFYREMDRQTSIAARGALRILLGAYAKVAPESICFNYTENGKPYISGSDLGFNVSHSGDWVVLAFGRNRQVGVDVEKLRREMDVMSIASRYFTPEESELIEMSDDVHHLFFHHWCRKEAYIKAIGSALFRELSSFAVPNEDGEKEGWWFYRLEAGSGYAAAVVSDKAAANIPCFDFCKMSW